MGLKYRIQVRVKSMQMNGIYANQAKSSMVVKQGMSSTGYEKGQIIEGIISKVSDEVSINFSGREVAFSKNTVQNAKEGEIRQFEIVDVTKKGIVLKEVGAKSGYGGDAGLTSCTMVNVDSYGLIASNKETTKKEDESQENLSETSNKLTSDDYANLSNEGFTLEKFNLERFLRAIERIKEQKNLKEKSIVTQTEQMKEMRESVALVAYSIATDTMSADKIAAKLIELDLPVTKENVERMLSTMDFAKTADKIDDAACEYLIRNELEPTAQNIYKSIHSGAKESNGTNDEAWQDLLGTVTGIMQEAGISIDDANLATARWLMDRELPITGENIKYKKFLDEIKEGDYVELALQFEALKIRNGNEIGNVFIYEENGKRAENIVNKVQNITEDGLLYACYKRQNIEQSLGTERENHLDEISIQELKEAEVEYSDVTSIDLNETKDSVTYITAKRQLEEIRLKLTTEACNKMLLKGISVETEGLSRVVEQLKTMENEYYSNLLKEVGASNEHLSLLKQTAESLQGLQEAPSLILGKTFETRTIQTIQSLSDVGGLYKEKYQNAGESYEALMTKPRSDLGDSIAKAFHHVDEILNDLGLDTTKANQRAVRILGYNSMEITNETISAMKAYDGKVNDLFKNLTPPVTATLIKEGINPLQLPLDEVNELAKSIIDRDGQSEEESFSEYLVRLEDKKELTMDERKSYIGIYRLLHQVDKSDGAAIGALVKAGAEITLNNLLTAIRTKNTGFIDASIDETFGTLASINKNGESIHDQINSAFESFDRDGVLKNDETLYQSNIVSHIRKDITPDKVGDSIAVFGDGFVDTSLERIKEQFDQVNTDTYKDPVIKNRMEQIQMLSKSTELEQQFLKEYDIPATINNLFAAKEMGENAASLYQNVDALMKSIAKKNPNFNPEMITEELFAGGNTNNVYIDSMDKPDKLTSLYDTFENQTKSLLGQALTQDNLDMEDLQLVNGIRSTLPLTINLSKREYFNIPMETNDGVIAMNLTVVHESTNKGQVSIKIPDKTNGTIQAELSIHNKQLKCFMTAENKTVLNQLKNQESELNSHFIDMGLTVEELYYAIKPTENSKFIFKNGSIYKAEDFNVSETSQQSSDATTDDLYRAAKTVVSHIQNWLSKKDSR